MMGFAIHMKKLLFLSNILVLIAAFILSGINSIQSQDYTVHKNITVTIFWIGENLNENNRYTRNDVSAWDNKWIEHYGGIDYPDKRNGFYPAGFKPLENPFYFALPYSDFDLSGKRKNKVYSKIPWIKEKNWNNTESMCKNRWIKITRGSNIAYAQWEDVGPFKMNDAGYVFGMAKPVNKLNNSAGLDVSPAVRDYLGLNGMDRIDWQFIDNNKVPSGPWKQIISTNQIFWE